MAKRYIRFFYGCREKTVKDRTPHPRVPSAHARDSREHACRPSTAKNRGILILQTHVSPHFRAEAWAQVVVTLATRRLPAKQPPSPGSPCQASHQLCTWFHSHTCAPSKYNEATRLDLQYEGTAPRVQLRHPYQSVLTPKILETGSN